MAPSTSHSTIPNTDRFSTLSPSQLDELGLCSVSGVFASLPSPNPPPHSAAHAYAGAIRAPAAKQHTPHAPSALVPTASTFITPYHRMHPHNAATALAHISPPTMRVNSTSTAPIPHGSHHNTNLSRLPNAPVIHSLRPPLSGVQLLFARPSSSTPRLPSLANYRKCYFSFSSFSPLISPHLPHLFSSILPLLAAHISRVIVCADYPVVYLPLPVGPCI